MQSTISSEETTDMLMFINDIAGSNHQTPRRSTECLVMALAEIYTRLWQGRIGELELLGSKLKRAQTHPLTTADELHTYAKDLRHLSEVRKYLILNCLVTASDITYAPLFGNHSKFSDIMQTCIDSLRQQYFSFLPSITYSDLLSNNTSSITTRLWPGELLGTAHCPPAVTELVQKINLVQQCCSTRYPLITSDQERVIDWLLTHGEYVGADLDSISPEYVNQCSNQSFITRLLVRLSLNSSYSSSATRIPIKTENPNLKIIIVAPIEYQKQYCDSLQLGGYPTCLESITQFVYVHSNDVVSQQMYLEPLVTILHPELEQDFEQACIEHETLHHYELNIRNRLLHVLGGSHSNLTSKDINIETLRIELPRCISVTEIAGQLAQNLSVKRNDYLVICDRLKLLNQLGCCNSSSYDVKIALKACVVQLPASAEISTIVDKITSHWLKHSCELLGRDLKDVLFEAYIRFQSSEITSDEWNTLLGYYHLEHNLEDGIELELTKSYKKGIALMGAIRSVLTNKPVCDKDKNHLHELVDFIHRGSATKARWKESERKWIIILVVDCLWIGSEHCKSYLVDKQSMIVYGSSLLDMCLCVDDSLHVFESIRLSTMPSCIHLISSEISEISLNCKTVHSSLLQDIHDGCYHDLCEHQSSASSLFNTLTTLHNYQSLLDLKQTRVPLMTQIISHLSKYNYSLDVVEEGQVFTSIAKTDSIRIARDVDSLLEIK